MASDDLVSTKRRLKALQQASIELIETHSLDKILAVILEKACDLLYCDAGSLYIKNEQGQLMFKCSLNKSLNISLEKRTIATSKKGLAVHCFNTGQALHVKDAYKIPKSKPYGFDKSFDEEMGYRSKSIIVYPLISTRGESLGAIQLINRKESLRQKWPSNDEQKIKKMPAFNKSDKELLESFSALASASLENAMLYTNIEKLFEGFVFASVKAIESRDVATKGHSERVATLTLDLARNVTRSQDHAVRSIIINDGQMDELRYAALLHDFGKIGIRESTLLKQKKLAPMQLHRIVKRIEDYGFVSEIQKMREFLEAASRSQTNINPGELAQLYASIDEIKAELNYYKESIFHLNQPTVEDKDQQKILNELQKIKFADAHGKYESIVTESEAFLLSIKKGSLSELERQEVQSHVRMTYDFLKEIPWSKGLENVPHIAHAHHEKLDGSGYPRQVNAQEIPIQSQMMTICDIYDALVAMDRPYKKAVPSEQALDIIEGEVKSGKLNGDLFKVFVESATFRKPDFVNLLSPQIKKVA